MPQPPRANRSIDIRTLPLCPEEAFVYSRVDGQTLPNEIALTTGMSVVQVQKALDRLLELGALEGRQGCDETPRDTQKRVLAPPEEGTRAAVGSSTSGSQRGNEGFVAVPDLDISAAEQERVWRLWKRLSQCDHYELLGLPRGASREQVKAAYFEHVSAFHPDKHFGKTLGTYKEKLEAVFQRLTQAHDTLSRTHRRELYDATLPPPLAGEALEPTAPSHRSSVEPKTAHREKSTERSESGPETRVSSAVRAAATSVPEDAHATPISRRAEVAAPVAAGANLRATPVSRGSVPPIATDQRRQMALRSLERNMRSMPGGERSAARPSVSGRRSPSGAPPSSRSVLLDRARCAENEGDFAIAAACYEKAAHNNKDPALFARAAECLETVAANTPDPAAVWKRAADSARQAVQLAPSNAQLRLVLSRVYAGAGMRASATREAEKAQELSPSDKSVQSWLERLRRGDV